MPYISLLNYWKNHDIEGVTNMVDDQVAAYYINEIGEPVALSKSHLIDMLHKRMKQVESNKNLQWNFEVIHRAHIYDKQTVIFYTYSQESSDYHETNKTMIAITFSARKANDPSPIKSIYITPNVKDFHN
ncbi:hypothetical protein C7J88_04330 [Staphylococcus muscae]|uniref:Uncharacterized protein n=1 Tax=Staphylococcus muscae TaxID=1294 RepID=A0A240C6L4_9STAP|nr:hypothetical protein [Staphylococcus muscae]AVQ33437.1 hypothetical protein C7J88_04330 [Staphylococcus muscae]PNZ04337.1 hypothetical protein CD131_04820 [Staphylococcus muscae]GGA90164.1 hypothetical protein GCM10007183_13000 [Staphylococcus muscae]SNW03252.1 Uncharacterised protein [Staphylococcus muscae]